MATKNLSSTPAKPRAPRAPKQERSQVRFEAILRTDPVPEHISFETLVRPTTLDVSVQER